jgi:arsenate reductase (glutaredoxin)
MSQDRQSPLRIYGIPNCDQVRAARAWLKAHGKSSEFVDLRATGLTAKTLDRWLTHLPWDALLNRRGMTWRQLAPETRAQVVDQSSAMELMLRHPLLVKRPVLEYGEQLSVGFSEPLYRSMFLDSA